MQPVVSESHHKFFKAIDVQLKMAEKYGVVSLNCFADVLHVGVLTPWRRAVLKDGLSFRVVARANLLQLLKIGIV